MFSKIALFSFVGFSLIAAISDTTWQSIVTGVVAIALGWMQYRTKILADAATAAAKHSAEVSNVAAAEVKDVKVLAVATNKLVNSGSLANLKFIEVLSGQLAQATGNERDIEQLATAAKNVRDHIEAQNKVDEDTKRQRDNEKLVAQEAVAKAVGIRVDAAIEKKLG